jgi:hypothetical protein
MQTDNERRKKEGEGAKKKLRRTRMKEIAANFK